MLESITGKNTFTVHDGDGYAVCKYRLNSGETVTVVGNVPTMRDLNVTCYGNWVINARYGRQFKCQHYEMVKPTDEKGVIAYLSSLKCGVGKTWAKRIYKEFGKETWDIIDKEPDKLITIKGFGQKRLDSLVAKVNETQVVRSVMSAFAGVMDISVKKAEQIAKQFGQSAVNIIQNQPYQLIAVKGLGFKTVEMIGKHFNASPCDPMRIRGALYYVIEATEAKGSTCVLKTTLISKTYSLLNRGYARDTVTKDQCDTEIQRLTLEGRFVIEPYTIDNVTKELIYRVESYKTEQSIADNLYRIAHGKHKKFKEEEIEKELNEYSKKHNFKLADTQKEAIKTVLTNKITVITGGPGTGKTTITKTLLAVYNNLFTSTPNILLMAPTGRAARRLAESTEHEARTIHSHIGYIPNESGEGYSAVSELDADMIIVDETSMVDQHIMSLLLKAVQNHTRVVFIGDANQLPSVGSGNVLADIIASKEIPVVKLRVVFRQGQQSPIIKNSRAILKGETELEFTNDFFYKGVQSDMKILSEACKFYVACVNKFGMDNVALLTPLRERTQISVASFNKQLQHYFNPKRDNSLTLKIHDTEFRKGDRIMQIKNTANALNGDIGYIKDIAYAFDPHDEKNFSVVCSVEFNGDGNVLKYTKEDMKNVMLAYAMTVHKSQGSEYETVIFISSDSHSIILRRDLVYTAITRAVKNVAIIGQKQALNDAIMNNNTEMRCTYLKKRIRNVFAKKQQKKGDERHAEQLSVG